MICPKCGKQNPDSKCPECNITFEPVLDGSGKEIDFHTLVTTYKSNVDDAANYIIAHTAMDRKTAETIYTKALNLYLYGSAGIFYKPKKPAHRKWWFWVLIVIFGLPVFAITMGMIFGEPVEQTVSSPQPTVSQSAEPTPAPTSSPTPSPSVSPTPTPSETPSPSPSPSPEEEMFHITAEELLAVYEENEIAADQELKGRTFEVTGVVDSIGRDILNDAYITLNSGDEYSLSSVQCYFKDSELDSLTELRTGDTVTVIGECDGKAILSVMMKKCKIK